jgi:hypothetical protein
MWRYRKVRGKMKPAASLMRGSGISATRDGLSWACEDSGSAGSQAGRAIQFILEVHRKDQSSAIQQALSAGQIEDLLATHGPVFIERMERRPSPIQPFAQLLGGVWKAE